MIPKARAEFIGDDGHAGGIGFDEDKSDRSGMVFRCSRARARANSSFLPDTSTGRYKGFLIVEMGFDPLSEIALILDNTSDDQTHSAQTSQPRWPDEHLYLGGSDQGNQVITAGLLSGYNERSMPL